MSKWISLVTALVLTATTLGARSRAEEVTVPADAKFVLRLDFRVLREGKLFDLLKRNAIKELGSEGLDREQKIKEMLGFDPQTEIRAIAISASSYENPELSLVASIKLGKTTGNLEGLILGLPGYQSEEHGKYSIYSATPDEGLRVFGAVHTDGQGDKTVVISARREAVINALDHLDGKSSGEGAFKRIQVGDGGKSVASLDVFEFPEEMKEEGPLGNIAKLLRTISVRINESGANLEVGVALSAATEKQAEQLRQLAQGGIAALEIARSMDPDDEELQKIQRIVHDIKATRDGSVVNLKLSVAEDEVLKLLEKETGVETAK